MHSSAPCLFLEAFPPELRLMVYEYLLVCSQPLATKDCAEPFPSGRTLDSGILAANRQIHDEAAAVLYGKNTFCVSPKRGGEGGIVAVARRYRHLVRSLRVEVLYCAGETVKTNEEEEGCPEVENSNEGKDLVEKRCRKQDHDAETYGMSFSPSLFFSLGMLQRETRALITCYSNLPGAPPLPIQEPHFPRPHCYAATLSFETHYSGTAPPHILFHRFSILFLVFFFSILSRFLPFPIPHHPSGPPLRFQRLFPLFQLLITPTTKQWYLTLGV